MTKWELIVKRQLETDGYTVLKNGWPDFFAFKEGHCKFVEVKSGFSQLSKEQRVILRALFKYTRIPYEVIRVK